jgi:condensin complex subunit 3
LSRDVTRRERSFLFRVFNWRRLPERPYLRGNAVIGRISAMPARTLPTGVDLATALARVFDQAQTSTANHQKNFVALHKLHLEAAKKKEPVKNGFKLTGEREFEAMFTDMLTRVLQVKKGATTADRIVKFVGGYIKFVNLKSACRRQFTRSYLLNLNLSLAPDDRPDTENAVEEDDEDTDTTASRFIARLLKFLLKGFLAKDKIVRYRVIFIVAEMVAHLGELECVVLYSTWSSLNSNRTLARISMRSYGRHCSTGFATRRS